MKALKIIGITILAIVAIILIAAAIVPKSINYEKSIVINAPIEIVWENINSLADMDQWSPWNDYDPNLKKTITGIDGTVGAMQSWDSNNNNVGKGSQTIAKLEPPTLIETKLVFYIPYESEAVGFVKLQKENLSTKATWGFKSVMPYPFNLMRLMVDFEDAMGKDFGIGLNKLKNICENN